MWTRSQAEQMRKQRGVASVELAIIAPVLIILMFGIVELGFLLRSAVQVNSVARDAARAAAAGESATLISQRIQETASGLDQAQLELVLQYRPYVGNGVWGATWLTLPSAGDVNTAPRNSQIRATVTYHHRLLMPGLFRFLVDNQTRGTRDVVSRVIMPRV